MARRGKAARKHGSKSTQRRRTKQARENALALPDLHPTPERLAKGDVEQVKGGPSRGNQMKATRVWRIDTLLRTGTLDARQHTTACRLRGLHIIAHGEPNVIQHYAPRQARSEAPYAEAKADAERELRSLLRHIGKIASPVIARVVFFDEACGSKADAEILRRALDEVRAQWQRQRSVDSSP